MVFDYCNFDEEWNMADRPEHRAVREQPKHEDALDDALADSFPASDPVAPVTPHTSVPHDRGQTEELAKAGDKLRGAGKER